MNCFKIYNLKFKINTGFTLIELLVVMAIIAILSALSLMGLSAARKATRDTRRKNDLGQYRAALEVWSQAHNFRFPNRDTYIPNNGTLYGIGTSTLCTIPDPAHPAYDLFSLVYNGYLPSCIWDPINNSANKNNCTLQDFSYCYIPNVLSGYGSATAYYLVAKLEGGGFWVVCSNGKIGKINEGQLSLPINLNCPLP